MSRITAVIIGLALAGGWVPAAAQNGVAFEGGVAMAAGESEFQAGIRASSMQPSHIGIDFALATFPDALANGVFNLMSDLDVEYRAPLGALAGISVRAGGSALVASADGSSGAAGGFNAGLGMILRVGAKTSFRADYTYRQYFGGGGSLGLSSLTFGLAIGY
jgi:hypothetical protein